MSMNSEEYYYLQYIAELTDEELIKIRVGSLAWVLECFERGKIRPQTIISLIPKQNLEVLLMDLEELERYEQCHIVKQLIDKVYIY